jgi:gliding motility-associated-like protein
MFFLKIIFRLIFYFFLFGLQRAYSQAPVVEWQKILGSNDGDYPNVIRTTSDGGYIVIGYSYSDGGDVVGYHGNPGLGDFWLVKLSSTGSVQWKKCLGGVFFDLGKDVRQTPDGGYIVTGASASNECYMIGQHGGADFLVIKLTADGDITWRKDYGGSKNEYASSIDITSDGGYVVGGFTESSNGDVTANHGGRDCWVIKIDGTGNLLWQKSIGGSGDEEINGIRATSDGGCIAVGYTASNDGDVAANHGNTDFLIVKLGSGGSLQWQKSLGGSGFEEALSIQLTTDGGFIVAGYTSSNDGDVSGNHQALGQFSDFWVVKLNNSGLTEWEKCYGGQYNEKAFYVQRTADNGYVVCGFAESANGDVSCNAGNEDMWVIKTDGAGNLQWQKSMGGSYQENAYCVQPLNDGGFIIAGLVTSNEITGYHKGPSGGTAGDYWIVKLSAPVSTSPAPSVTIHPASGKVCAGSSATFTASALYAGTNPVYQWVLNGSKVGSNSPVYTSSGFAENDQLVCKVSNGSVCEPGVFNATDAITIHVNNSTIQPKITITASNTLICNCNPVSFNSNVLNGGSSSLYEWKVNGIVVEDNGNKFITSSLKPGDIITCVYTDSTSCILNESAFSNPIQMTTGSSLPASVAIAASATSVCKGTRVMFVANASNAGVTPSFQWKVNGTNEGANSNTFDSTGLSDGDIISCIVTPNVAESCIMPGNAISNNITITVNDNSPATINISASSDTICTGQTITFNASVTNAGVHPSYQWKVNGMNTGSNSNQFVSSTLTNADIITCTLIPDPLSACTNTAPATSGQVQIIINPDVIPVVKITASANDVCAGETINFNAAVQNAGSKVSYQWMVNDAEAGDNSPVFSSNQLSNGDIITCSVTDVANTCSISPVSSNGLTAIVNTLPLIHITPGDTVIAPGTVIQLNATIIGNILSFQWSPADKLNDASLLQPSTVALTDNTVYTLTAESDKGCKSSAMATAKVFRMVAMPNAFTPNGDGINDIFRIPAGTVTSLNEFSVFNRFGERVFSTKNPAIGWDGFYNNKAAVAGVYVYILKGTTYNGPLSIKGIVVLIR